MYPGLFLYGEKLFGEAAAGTRFIRMQFKAVKYRIKGRKII